MCCVLLQSVKAHMQHAVAVGKEADRMQAGLFSLCLSCMIEI